MVSTQARLRIADAVLFNGDTDGLCALQLLRLAGRVSPEAQFITGVKRDTRLASRLSFQPSLGCLTALDIGLEKNLDALSPFLQQGVWVQWVDHHETSVLPTDPNLQLYLKRDPSWNTTRIVYDVLGAQVEWLPWLLMGLCGDNMRDAAWQLAQGHGVTEGDFRFLQEAGELLNYNAYGASIEELCIDPHLLAAELAPFSTPWHWASRCNTLERLAATYQSDLAHAEAVAPRSPHLYCLPNVPWARRMMGPLGNLKSTQFPDKAVAVLVDSGLGYHGVSLRVPEGWNAAEFCRQFPTGGGRVRSAGINQLPDAQIETFIQAFQQHFGGRVS